LVDLATAAEASEGVAPSEGDIDIASSEPVAPGGGYINLASPKQSPRKRQRDEDETVLMRPLAKRQEHAEGMAVEAKSSEHIDIAAEQSTSATEAAVSEEQQQGVKEDDPIVAEEVSEQIADTSNEANVSNEEEASVVQKVRLGE
jgi:hypothetical protein